MEIIPWDTFCRIPSSILKAKPDMFGFWMFLVRAFGYHHHFTTFVWVEKNKITILKNRNGPKGDCCLKGIVFLAGF